jgi:hypothetical protein
MRSDVGPRSTCDVPQPGRCPGIPKMAPSMSRSCSRGITSQVEQGRPEIAAFGECAPHPGAMTTGSTAVPGSRAVLGCQVMARSSCCPVVIHRMPTESDHRLMIAVLDTAETVIIDGRSRSRGRPRRRPRSGARLAAHLAAKRLTLRRSLRCARSRGPLAMAARLGNLRERPGTDGHLSPTSARTSRERASLSAGHRRWRRRGQLGRDRSHANISHRRCTDTWIGDVLRGRPGGAG